MSENKNLLFMMSKCLKNSEMMIMIILFWILTDDLIKMNEENQNQLFQVTTWKNKYDNNNNDQCWHYDELKFFEICFIAAAEKTFSVNNDWWVLFNIYKQQLSVKTDTFLTAVSTVMSDDAADSDIVTNT